MNKDRSHSEFWSSFSSSEEMLLECEGLLLSLPLAPHHKCLPPNKNPDYEEASHQNTVTYKYVLLIYAITVLIFSYPIMPHIVYSIVISYLYNYFENTNSTFFLEF